MVRLELQEELFLGTKVIFDEKLEGKTRGKCRFRENKKVHRSKKFFKQHHSESKCILLKQIMTI